MSDVRYFNFPVVLLQDFMNNSHNCFKNILHYSLYAHALRLDYDDLKDKFESAIDYYDIPVESVDETLQTAMAVYNSIPANTPLTGLNVDIFWSFFLNDKSEFEKVSLLGFLAIRSILGLKAYCKIDNRFWLARMDGHPRSCNAEFLSDAVRKYSSEYMTKKIKNELKDNWGLKSYSRYTRGFYVSFAMSLPDLVKIAELSRRQVKEKQKRLEEKQMLEKVLEELRR